MGVEVLSRIVKLAALAAFWVVSAAPRQPPQSLAQADRFFQEKSYVNALEAYEGALKAGTVPAGRRDEVALRVVTCLGESKRWDTAFESGIAFVKAHRGTVWEPRALSVLGRLYFQAPHNGYRVDGKVVRERNGSRQDSDRSSDDGIALYAQDVQNSRDAFEAACVLYPRFRAEFHTETDESQNAYDLSRVLREFFVESWASKRVWAPPENRVWRVDPTAPFDPAWPPPKKLAYIYAFIEHLAGDDSHQAALALLGRAAWLRMYHQVMPRHAWSEDYEKPVWKPYPYEEDRAEATLANLITRFPNDPVRDQAEIIYASILTEQGEMTAAERRLERFLQDRPNSRGAPEAKDFLRRIREPEMTFHTTCATGPDRRTPLEIRSRNVTIIHFEAFRFDLTRALNRAETEEKTAGIGKRGTRFVDAERFLQLKDFDKELGAPAAAWDEATGDPGDHLHRTKKSTVPITEVGSYILRASAPGVSATGLAIVTDLVFVVKSHGAKDLYFVAGAISGKPVPGARLTTDISSYQQHKLLRTTTDANGLADVTVEGQAARDVEYVHTLAALGSRYALLEPESLGFRHGEEARTLRAYGITDRAVYRPGQTLHYRQILARVVQGAWKPLPNQMVSVVIKDSHQTTVHSKTLTSNAFGSVNGKFTLPADAALGQYSMLATVVGEDEQKHHSTGNWFRVEEYKKPEFRVTVQSGKPVRAGDKASATIRAAYYFGAPVARARVTYRVYRSEWYYGYHYPRAYDYLYGWTPEFARPSSRGDDKIAAQGVARTDAKGEAHVTFQTTDPPESRGRGDYVPDNAYTVEADVQDASRRTVFGSGYALAVRRDFSIYTEYPHGYARPGEPVDIQLKAQDAVGTPVAASGEVRIFPTVGYRNDEDHPVAVSAWSTGKDGKGRFHWVPAAAGHYSARFRARDSRGKEIDGWESFWVAGAGLDKIARTGRQTDIILRDPDGMEGSVTHALLIAPAAGCTVLLTREGDHEIYERKLITMPGRAMEIEVPLKTKDVPGIILKALIVRNGSVYESEATMKVAAVRHIARVTLRPDRAKYEPGQRAHMLLHAQDSRGRPLRTELSVSVSDASLDYIDSSRGEDIREFAFGGWRVSWIRTESASNFRIASESPRDETERRDVYVDWGVPQGMGRLDLG